MTNNARLPELETARLILRTYLFTDTDDLLSMWRDPDLTQFFPPNFKDFDENERRGYVTRINNIWLTRGFSQWGVFSKNDGKLIGYCGLQLLNGTSEVELYYGIARRAWGQGIATEAARAAVQYGFEELNLERLTALTFPQNIASQKVLHKLNFKPGGIRSFYQEKVFYFEMLRQEYARTEDKSFYYLRYHNPDAS